MKFPQKPFNMHFEEGCIMKNENIWNRKTKTFVFLVTNGKKRNRFADETVTSATFLHDTFNMFKSTRFSWAESLHSQERRPAFLCPQTHCRQSEEGDGKHGEAGCNSLPDPRLRHFVSVSDGGHCHLRREEAEMNRGNPIWDKCRHRRVDDLTSTSSERFVMNQIWVSAVAFEATDPTFISPPECVKGQQTW